MFFDCYRFGTAPKNDDKPAEVPVGLDPYKSGEGFMADVCINRHPAGTINVLFMNWSVRKVGLKELWHLKWHRKFDTNYPPPPWPQWMAQLSEFYYEPPQTRTR